MQSPGQSKVAHYVRFINIFGQLIARLSQCLSQAVGLGRWYILLKSADSSKQS
jgi:hypothetical protein